MAYVVSNPANLGQDTLVGGTQVSTSESADLIVTFQSLYTGVITRENTYTLSTAAGAFDPNAIVVPTGGVISNITYDSPADGIETVSYTIMERVIP